MPAANLPRNVIGAAVARSRSAREWSQSTLAAKCQLTGWDVSRGVIAGIEGRYRVVQDWELFVLAKVLRISADKLLPDLIDWRTLPAPSEKTQAKRRRNLARVKAELRRTDRKKARSKERAKTVRS